MTDTELDSLVLRALAEAPEGLPLSRLLKALPPALRPDEGVLAASLARLVARSQAFAWPGRGRVHAARTFDEAITERILARMSAGPCTLAEIRRAIPAAAQARTAALLRRLVAEGRAFKHPRLGRRDPYGLTPAEPGDYVEAPLRRLVATIARKGFDVAAVRSAVARAAGGGSAARPLASDDGTVVLTAIETLNPQARSGALVYIPHLRAAVADRLADAGAFERCILALAAQGRVQIQTHPIPSQLTPAERAAMVPDGAGGYYSAIGLP